MGRKRKIPIGECVELRHVHGWTLQKIADKFGCTHSGVGRVLQKYGPGTKVKLKSVSKEKKKRHGLRLEVPDSILDQYAEGKDLSELAAEAGCSASTISNRLRERGEKLRPGGRRAVFSRIHIYECVRLRHEEKWTLQKLGDRFGVSRERIRQILNTTEKGSGGSIGVKVGKESPQYKELPAWCVEAYENGESCISIAKRAGLCTDSVRKKLKDAGVEVTTKGKVYGDQIKHSKEEILQMISEIEDPNRTETWNEISGRWGVTNGYLSKLKRGEVRWLDTGREIDPTVYRKSDERRIVLPGWAYFAKYTWGWSNNKIAKKLGHSQNNVRNAFRRYEAQENGSLTQ